MPLAGFRCPQGSPTFGETNTIDHCLAHCPHKCAAPSLLAAIYKADTENHHVGNYISASMFASGSCSRQTVLERKHDFYDFPVRRFWPFRGTIAHSVVEQAVGLIDQYGWLSEMRMKVALTYPDLPAPIFNDAGEFTGEFSDDELVIEVGGTCDSYNPVTKELWDIKTMADAKAEMMVTGSKPGTFSPHLEDSWVKQLNVYRWLIANSPIPTSVKKQLGLKGKLFPAPEYLGIQGVSMMNIPRTGAEYPLWVKNRGMNIYTIEKVPVWPLEETEQFVREEALKWFKYLNLGMLPPVVGEDKKWLCRGCALNGERFEGGVCFPDAERKQQARAIDIIIED